MKAKPIEIIQGRLYWISDYKPPTNIKNSFYFNIDDDLEYEPFYMDFGPLNLGKAWKYVSELNKLLQNPSFSNNKIYHFTSVDNAKASNAAFLMGTFLIIIKKEPAEKVFDRFKHIPFKPFRDASYNKNCSYKCTLLDCWRGLEYAIKLNWFNFHKFNLNEYEHYEKVENGDLNWIIPNKFIAFSSPFSTSTDKYGNRVFTPADYVPIFKKMGVKTVIRLNNKTYDSIGFTKEGIKHEDLIFPDGTAPSDEIVQKFLQIVEKQEGAVAVHCKAGLGRTGCLIACYAMKHYYFPAADFIGWIRIARPGSILGPQQHFLIQMQEKMRALSKDSPIWQKLKDSIMQKYEKDAIQKIGKLSLNNSNERQKMSYKSKEITKMNQIERQVLQHGQTGQGQYLVKAKLQKEQKKKQSLKR